MRNWAPRFSGGIFLIDASLMIGRRLYTSALCFKMSIDEVNHILCNRIFDI
jgi:hypothetical protein